MSRISVNRMSMKINGGKRESSQANRKRKPNGNNPSKKTSTSRENSSTEEKKKHHQMDFLHYRCFYRKGLCCATKGFSLASSCFASRFPQKERCPVEKRVEFIHLSVLPLVHPPVCFSAYLPVRPFFLQFALTSVLPPIRPSARSSSNSLVQPHLPPIRTSYHSSVNGPVRLFTC